MGSACPPSVGKRVGKCKSHVPARGSRAWTDLGPAASNSHRVCGADISMQEMPGIGLQSVNRVGGIAINIAPTMLSRVTSKKPHRSTMPVETSSAACLSPSLAIATQQSCPPRDGSARNCTSENSCRRRKGLMPIGLLSSLTDTLAHS